MTEDKRVRTYQIRGTEGRADDATLHALHDACFAQTAARIDPTKGHWWVAFDPNEPDELVGFCGLLHTYAQPKSVGYVKRVGVLQEHRGAGFKGALLTLARFRHGVEACLASSLTRRTT